MIPELIYIINSSNCISNLNNINITKLNYNNENDDIWTWEMMNIKSNSNIVTNLNDINITKLNDNNDNDDTWTEW